MLHTYALEFALIFVALVGVGYWLFRSRGASSQKKSQSLAFAIDLLAQARADELESVTERDEEIERMIHIILRRTKNNPLLIGQPGVGKTAIVEGLALRMVRGDVPEQIAAKQLFSLDIASFIADTKYRGELEKRMQSLLHQLAQFKGEVMLFIDEIHMLEQLGGAEGSLHVSDMLKPALARGKVQVIGATTWQEYEASIQKDQALDRRFQPVLVDEPTPEEAVRILEHLRPTYEEYHKVKITDKALKEAVRISDEEIEDRYLPDKAIDLLDEASAKVSIEATGTPRVAAGLLHASAKASNKQVEEQDIRDVAEQWLIHSQEDRRRDARKEE